MRIEEAPGRQVSHAEGACFGQLEVRAVNHAVERLVAELASQGLVRANVTIHGLRHVRSVEIALAGDGEIMAQLTSVQECLQPPAGRG